MAVVLEGGDKQKLAVSPSLCDALHSVSRGDNRRLGHSLTLSQRTEEQSKGQEEKEEAAATHHAT